MFNVRFNNVCIESLAFNRPPIRVTTNEIEDRLADVYKKFKVPIGTLEKLSGIQARHFFEKGTPPSEIATGAAKTALERCEIEAKDLGAVFNCSVTRDYFEPATSILVHKNIGCKEEVMGLDITNACIGFSNGMMLMANLIESGVIKAGLITSGENMAPITDTTFDKILGPEGENLTRGQFAKMLPTFTLGSGGVAMVMCHRDISVHKHRYFASHARSASQHADLCIGNGDFCFMQPEGLDPLMETDSKLLISSAAKLGARAWPNFSELTSWSAEDLDHIVCHQVGKQVNESFYGSQGLPHDREHVVYPEFGNLVSAAMPSAFADAAEQNKYMTGDKILLTAYGSGLNTVFSGVIW